MYEKSRSASTLLCLAIVLLLSACGPTPDASYTEYYVGVLGSDSSGDGSASNPWRHVQYALENLDYDADPRPRLNLLKGIYEEEITITRSIDIKGAGEWGPAAVFPDNPDLPTTEVSMLVIESGRTSPGHVIQGSGISVYFSDIVFAWGGVHVLGGASATFDHVQFDQVRYRHGLQIIDSPAFAVRDSEITTPLAIFSDIGIDVRHSIGFIERTSIGEYFDHPISIARYPDGPVTVVTIDDVDIAGSLVSFADGIRMFGRPSVTISNSRIHRSAVGAETWTSGSDGAAAGIQVQNTTDGNSSNRIEITGNTISGFDVGINIDAGGFSVKAENNDVAGNRYAVHIADYYDRSRSPAIVDFGGGPRGSVGDNIFRPPSSGYSFFVEDGYEINACFNDWVVPDSEVDPNRIWDQLDDLSSGRVRWDVCARESIEAGTPLPPLVEILPGTTDIEEQEPTATAIRNAACREGADASRDVSNFLYQGEITNLIGRLANLSWFYVELPEERGRCWIFTENLDLVGLYSELPVYSSPDSPKSEDGGEAADEGSGASDGGQQTDPEGPEDCDPQTEYWSDNLQACTTLN